MITTHRNVRRAPLDLLKEEMERLTREMADAERTSKNATKTIDELDQTLRNALTVASTCHQQYLAAPPHIRRQINQGFFTRLLIAPDGSVERAELTEPFATLLADTNHETPRSAQGAPEVLAGARDREPDVDPLDALAANHELVSRLAGWQWHAVRAAREAGAIWDQIGEATGVTGAADPRRLPRPDRAHRALRRRCHRHSAVPGRSR